MPKTSIKYITISYLRLYKELSCLQVYHVGREGSITSFSPRVSWGSGIASKFIPMDVHLFCQQIFIGCLLPFCRSSEICGCTTDLTQLIFWCTQCWWTNMPSNKEEYRDQRIEEGGGYLCTLCWSRKTHLLNQLWQILVDREGLSPEETSFPGRWVARDWSLPETARRSVGPE